MAWTDTTSTTEDWQQSSYGATTWDAGTTKWDISGNVYKTEWDVPGESWTDTSSTSESWVDI